MKSMKKPMGKSKMPMPFAPRMGAQPAMKQGKGKPFAMGGKVKKGC